MSDFLSFQLTDDFIEPYIALKPDWGFNIGGENSLSELTFILKYSRKKEDGTKERWWEVCRRCVEGMYSILKDHAKYNKTPWNDLKAQKSARDAYDRMFHFKWTPPGRGLQHMGTRYIAESRNGARLINCAAVTTEKLSTHSAYQATLPFVRLMEMSMNGIGVGIDTRGAGNITLHQPLEEKEIIQVEDTREAWAQSLGTLLESYFFKNRKTIEFDYSLIRPEGAILKSFGGTASGPGPLKRMHDKIAELLSDREGQPLSSRDIIDIANLSGKAAVAGGSRRSALIGFGYKDDTDYVNLKNWNLPENAERTGPDGWAWASNNSIIANSEEDLSSIIDQIKVNGEPGIIWTDIMSRYGRLNDPINDKDTKSNLSNPCGEIQLEDGELCNLSELYPTNHSDIEDLKKTIKHAYMYTKAVTLLPTPWAETNEVLVRNRRIGVGMTGLAQFVENSSWAELRNWMNEGYRYLVAVDKKYSSWLGVRESVALSTIKPAGSTSLIAAVTPGAHWPTTGDYHIRRVRFLNTDPLLDLLKAAGYTVEKDINDPLMTAVVSFPTTGINMRSEREVSVWEKASLAALAQRYWSDNMVSCTLSFTEEEADQLEPLFNSFQGQLKSASFLPIHDAGTTYAQAPYEPLSEKDALKWQAKIKTIPSELLYQTAGEFEEEKFCNSDSCTI